MKRSPVFGNERELAYMDLGRLNGQEPSGSWVEPIWPVPDDDPPGRVWIADEISDPECDHDGLFELVDGQLVEVRTSTGVSLRAHWERSVQDGQLELSPDLLFRSLTAAIAWAQTLTDAIVIALHNTEPTATYRMGDRNRQFPEVPAGLVEAWDRRYASG